MRIGILTFHRSVNNGAVMQCYSLSKKLKEDFPDDVVEVVDYQLPLIDASYEASIKTYFSNSSFEGKIKRAGKLVLNPMMFQHIKKRNEIFKKSLNNLPLSTERVYDNRPEPVFEYINGKYDALIVGSDAVWNYISRGFPNAYFPDSSVRCHKLSYAASCYGMEFTGCEDNRKRIGEILSTFDFLGVRDCATEDFVKWSGCGKDPIHCCDPTAFLNINELPINIGALEHKLKKRGFDFDRPKIGVMGNKQMVQMIRKFYGSHYQIVSLFNYIRGADVQLYDITPYEWAYVFRYFKLTFTTYFHGTMLSLRNGVPLICVALETEFANNHTPKTLDVLTRLGFQDWYFHTDYKTTGLSEIKEKADKLLATDMKQEILNRLDRESQSYFALKEALLKIRTNKLNNLAEKRNSDD